MSGGKLKKVYSREYVHTHTNVNEDSKKGEVGMSNRKPVNNHAYSTIYYNY
jgi:hypothetical protein